MIFISDEMSRRPHTALNQRPGMETRFVGQAATIRYHPMSYGRDWRKPTDHQGFSMLKWLFAPRNYFTERRFRDFRYTAKPVYQVCAYAFRDGVPGGPRSVFSKNQGTAYLEACGCWHALDVS